MYNEFRILDVIITTLFTVFIISELSLKIIHELQVVIKIFRLLLTTYILLQHLI